MQPGQQTTVDANSVATQKKTNRYYVLGILTVVYAFNFIDRQILGILAPFIQQDLGLTDSQIGFLGGTAFALFYTFMGLPVAWLADRYNRVTIVSVSLAVWSGFTAVCGLAQSFLHLAIARIGVGIGEAGGSPPSHAMLSDLFDKTERAKALAIYSLGIPFGIMIAYFASALLAGRGDAAGEVPWRSVFMIVGLPGVLCALILKLTVPEPVRGAQELTPKPEQAGNFRRGLSILLKIPSYWGMALGISLASFGAYAVSIFYVAFVLREFPGTNIPSLLVKLGLINGLAYGLGTYLGGYLADRWAKTNPASYALVPAYSIFFATPCFIYSLIAADLNVALLLVSVYLFLKGFYLGPSFSTAQTLAPVSVRAMSTAIFFFVLNLIGLGGGPLAVGYLSDYLQTQNYSDVESLRLALASLGITYTLAILAFYWTSTRLPKDLERAAQNAHL